MPNAGEAIVLRLHSPLPLPPPCSSRIRLAMPEQVDRSCHAKIQLSEISDNLRCLRIKSMATHPPQEQLQKTEKLSPRAAARRDRKSTRLNSSHVSISYAVFCLKKKTK